MFPKNLTVLQFDDTTEAEDLSESMLAAQKFVPIPESSALSVGWDGVREGQRAYFYQGFTLLKLTVEKKTVPQSTVKRLVNERAAAIEQETGKAPGKKARKELADQISDVLLARAIPTRASTLVWLDWERHRVLIDSTSPAVVDSVLHLMYITAEIECSSVEKWPSRATVRGWLWQEDEDTSGSRQDMPFGLTADDTVTLQHPGADGKEAVLKHTNMEDEDVLKHLAMGAEPLTLAVTWDDKVSFKWKDTLGALAGIKALDVLNESTQVADADRFDTGLYLAGATMRQLVDRLVEVA